MTRPPRWYVPPHQLSHLAWRALGFWWPIWWIGIAYALTLWVDP